VQNKVERKYMDTRAGAVRQSGIQVITVKGQRLRVSIRPGDGVRMPLVLMNGLGAQLEVLQPLLDALSPSLEVICFDVPGIGGSPPPVIPYRPSSLASLIAHMLDRLAYKQVDMLGMAETVTRQGLEQVQQAIQQTRELHSEWARNAYYFKVLMNSLIIGRAVTGFSALV
jgi:hypothetical protein